MVELWYELGGLCHVFLFVDRCFRGVLVLAREEYEATTISGWRSLAEQLEGGWDAGEAEQHNHERSGGALRG